MNIVKKFIIYLVIVIIIYVSIIFFVIIPTTSDIQAISDQIYNERIDLEKRYKKGQLIKQLVEDFRKIKPQQDRLELIFVKESEILNFVTSLENLANNNNIDLSIKLKEIENTNNIASMPLDLTIGGSYQNVIAYLNDIEKQDYYFSIDSIRINSAGQTAGIINLFVHGDIFIELE
ncbi:type 4a pilus biogenesis protein PilO [Patescibacteria group bacterium]|nr:type 4a pilus biogenesis protein PilO [Patescibacteria group bacterium]